MLFSPKRSERGELLFSNRTIAINHKVPVNDVCHVQINFVVAVSKKLQTWNEQRPVQCCKASLAELGESLQNVAVLCTTTYENRTRESFIFLNAVFTARQDVQEILYENVSFLHYLTKEFLRL